MTNTINEQQTEQIRSVAQAIEAEDLARAQTTLEPLREQLPEHPDVWQLAGALAMRQGNPTEAIGHLSKVTQLAPSFIPAWVSLFQCHQALGDLDSAINALRNAVKINSSDHNLSLALADTQLKAGQFSGVLETLDPLPSEIAEQNPIQSVKAAALQGLGRLPEAEDVLTRALNRDGQDNRIRLQLAGVQQTQRRFDEAIASYRQALEQDPGFTPARYGLATTNEALGRFDEAIEAMRQVVNEDPQHIPAQTQLGSYLERSGKLDEAEAVLNTALKNDPQDVSAHLHLAQCERRRGQIEAAAARLDAVSIDRVPQLMQIAWYAEQAQLQDRLGNFSQAMECFEAGNAVARSLWQESNPGANAFAQRLMKTLQWMRESQNSDWSGDDQLPQPTPVFLIGFPRTGTTLLGRILNAHSSCVELDEYPTLNFLAQVIEQKLGGYPNALGQLDDEQRDRLRNSYMAHMSRYADFEGNTHIIDKLPMNTEFLPLIARVFPGAKIILARRHPLASVLSCYMQPFQLNPAMANFHSLEDAAGIYSTLDTIVAESRRLWPELPIHEMRYEKLVASPETEVRALLEFLELPFEEQVLEQSGRSGGGIRTPSYRQVDQEIYADALDHWKNYEKWLEPVQGSLSAQISAYQQSQT